MDIVGLNQVPSQGGQVQTSEKEVMGKDDFLQLLVVQLQAQDPLNPMDATAFTAQLAQFSSLEQLQNVNGSLSDMVTSQAIMTNSQAVGFIGKTVSAVGNAISVSDGESSPLQVELDSDAASVYIGIYNSQGGFVRDLEVGALAAGRHDIDWDAHDYLGDQAGDGSYTFEINALDADGNSIDTATYTTGTVTGVNFRNGTAYLLMGDQQVEMGHVVEVLSNNDSQ